MPRVRLPLSSLILSAVLAVGGAIALLSFPPAVAGDRSGKWPAIEKKFLADHPTCAFCGKDATVVHHVRPFAEYPEDELLESNLLALCPECHGTIAHLNRHYDHWNPLVVEEAKLHAAMVAARPKTKAEAAAFVKRFGRCFEPANYRRRPESTAPWRAAGQITLGTGAAFRIRDFRFGISRSIAPPCSASPRGTDN